MDAMLSYPETRPRDFSLFDVVEFLVDGLGFDIILELLFDFILELLFGFLEVL
jgi:hypothetical protein